jgi:tetratricopeptide (TPR) repeat protein
MVYRARTLLLQSRPEKLKKAYGFLDKAWIQKDCLEFRMQDYIANHLAGVCIRLGRYSEAHQWLNKEDNLLGKSNLEQDQVSKFKTYIKRERAEIYLNEGKLDKAESLCQSIISEVEESRAQNYANHLLAKIIIAQEDETRYEEARRYLLSGLEEVEIHQDKRRIAYYHATLAELGYLMDPDDLDSRRYAEKAYKIFQDLDMFQEKNSMQSLLSKVPSNLSSLSNKLQQRLKNSQIVVMCLDCIKFHMNSVTAFYTEMVEHGYLDNGNTPQNYDDLRLHWVRWNQQIRNQSKYLNLIVYHSGGQSLDEDFLFYLNNFGGNIAIIDRRNYFQFKNLYQFDIENRELVRKIENWINTTNA